MAKGEKNVLFARGDKEFVGRKILLGETDEQKTERLELAVGNKFPQSEVLKKLEMFGIKEKKLGKT